MEEDSLPMCEINYSCKCYHWLGPNECARYAPGSLTHPALCPTSSIPPAPLHKLHPQALFHSLRSTSYIFLLCSTFPHVPPTKPRKISLAYGMQHLNCHLVGAEPRCGSNGSLGRVSVPYNNPIGTHTITSVQVPPMRGLSRRGAAIIF